MSFLKKGVFITALILTGTATADNSYQSTFSVGYGLDKYDDYERNNYGVGGTYYLSPVKAGNYPYALVGTVERVSSLSLILGKSTNSYSSTTDDETKSGSVSTTLANTDTPFKLELNYRHSSQETLASTYSSDVSNDNYGAQLIYYIDDHTQVRAGGTYSYSTRDFTSLSSQTTTKSHGRSWSAGLWHLGILEDEKFYTVSTIILAPGSMSLLDYYFLGVTGDYYFSRSLSLGGFLGTAHSGDSGIDSNHFSIGTQYFLTPSVSVRASFSKTNYESIFSDSRSWDIGVAVRY